MGKIHGQLKERRAELGLTQGDMAERVGMSRQQYNRLETQGNPRLDTLELIAKGLKLELILIPQESLQAVRVLLDEARRGSTTISVAVSDNPWQGLLEEES